MYMCTHVHVHVHVHVHMQCTRLSRPYTSACLLAYSTRWPLSSPSTTRLLPIPSRTSAASAPIGYATKRARCSAASSAVAVDAMRMYPLAAVLLWMRA